MHKLGQLPRYSQHIHTGLTSYHKTFANIAKNIVMGYKKREARIYQSEKKPLEKVSILAYSHFRPLGEDFREKKILNRLWEISMQDLRHFQRMENVSASCK